MTKEDPFERAAKRERIEEARREAMIARMKRGASSGSEGAGAALATFFLPFVVWGLLRAVDHRWGEPSTARAVVRFFFGTGFWFAAMTVSVLVLLWVWMIQRAGGDDDDD